MTEDEIDIMTEDEIDMTVTFGDVIRKKRLSLGFELKHVADRIFKHDGKPIHIQYLSDLERNKRNPPSEYYLQQFADYLGLKNEYLCYLAGKLPQKFIVEDVTQIQVVEAFEAFRLSLRINIVSNCVNSLTTKNCILQPKPVR